MKRNISWVVLLVMLAFSSNLQAQSGEQFQLKNLKSAIDIQPTMWGIFFEDINFAADGGLYAEMVKNRSFEFDTPMMSWQEANEESNPSELVIINLEDLKPENPRFARLKLKGNYTLLNEGFRGMGVKNGDLYNFSIQTKLQKGAAPMRMKIALVNAANEEIGAAELMVENTAWSTMKASFTAKATEEKAKLRLTFEGEGELDMDMISLFPQDTWKQRPGGLRKDIVEKLEALQPGFLRFPGGCIVEGRVLAERYQWKKTVGAIDQRTGLVNRWNTEFDHRLTPDYFQTFGLGFYEYFLLSEDLGAEALPILSCGIACQFNTGELVPMDHLDPYVQDALDLIEFANGATTTAWGKLRADMGHPEPFNLKYIGVGNEQWGPQYIERYIVFEKAIKAKYPDMIIVSGTGPFPDGEDFDYAAKELKKLNAELVDEHYYNTPEWFLSNANRYDAYDRNGPKIFAGEYAAQSVAIASPDNKNNWQCALSEAAFMTGLERNADIVHMTSYAPLLAHAEAWQWTPDMIWFNNLESYATPNYYVQQLFSNHAGNKVLDLKYGKQPATGADQLYASAVLDEANNQLILKVVNASDKDQDKLIKLGSDIKINTKAEQIILQSKDLKAENGFSAPEHIAPQHKTIEASSKKMTLHLPAQSLSIFKLDLQSVNVQSR
ncbi:alpha-L-arabinofuranosidase C-terminal domain-containing protein [Persicobacter diffluens]|uniref:non-reducing end alpha-L-arabinofuranosidase n=1 Tax=Persicobacter diffluens TaxID=981 RepID=A0AAN4W4N5_9BACT|nr:alpha-L-arabinofuranosidase [Persicobacter diffluens]